jgi:hypothetical protein
MLGSPSQFFRNVQEFDNFSVGRHGSSIRDKFQEQFGVGAFTFRRVVY